MEGLFVYLALRQQPLCWTRKQALTTSFVGVVESVAVKTAKLAKYAVANALLVSYGHLSISNEL
jgi:hypothetical protein